MKERSAGKALALPTSLYLIVVFLCFFVPLCGSAPAYGFAGGVGATFGAGGAVGGAGMNVGGAIIGGPQGSAGASFSTHTGSSHPGTNFLISTRRVRTSHSPPWQLSHSPQQRCQRPCSEHFGRQKSTQSER